MFTSTVIATVGRSTLTRSVESVLAQQGLPADFEVIVVNDSGHQLSSADWHRSERVTILQTNCRERCVARNTGAAVSHGTYLHFLDDDDWMLPGAFKELWSVAEASNAAWIYGASQLLDKDGKLLTQHYVEVGGNAFVQVMAGDWIPLQASLIKTECFFAVGGFDFRLTVCEDKDVCRRVALHGELAGTPVPVAGIVRNREDTTSAYNRATDYSVWSRDNILEEKGSFDRMWASAKTPYWRGRLVRAYLTCVHWNLRRWRILRALNRAGGAALSATLSIADVASQDFRHALIHPHTRKNVF